MHARVRNAQKLPGVEEITLPGERGNRMAKQRLAAGVIPIEPNMLSSLRVMAAKADQGSSPSASSSLLSASGGPREWEKMNVATKIIHAKTSVNDPYLSSGPPLWQTATFAQPTSTTNGEYDYTRSGNPTRTMLEEQVRA